MVCQQDDDTLMSNLWSWRNAKDRSGLGGMSLTMWVEQGMGWKYRAPEVVEVGLTVPREASTPLKTLMMERSGVIPVANLEVKGVWEAPDLDHIAPGDCEEENST